MVELIGALDPQRVAQNLARIEAELEAARERSSHGAEEPVRVLAATKYLPDECLPALHDGGVRLVGENRAQDLERRAALHGALFEWHFIGQLQSRRVRKILPHVRLIHSLASESALGELARHRDLAQPGAGILIEVNVAGEEGKAGVDPGQLGRYLEDSPLPVEGLMTMPPLSADPEAGRPWFAALRDLAASHGLSQLSMGTSQDYVTAAEEGATIVRIGTNLYH